MSVVKLVVWALGFGLLAITFPGLADAGLRVTISDGVNPNQVFNSPGAMDDIYAFGFTIGEFAGQAELVTTNASGTAAEGFITQSITFSSTGSSSGYVFSAFAEVIGDPFTLPSAPTLYLTADATGTSGGPNGTVTVISTYNNSIAIATSELINAPVSSSLVFTPVTGTSPYSLTNLLRLNGVQDNSTSFTVTGQTTVRPNQPTEGTQVPPMPEPASMVMWSLGACLIGSVGCFKRRRKAA